jgi:hypothetical protein
LKGVVAPSGGIVSNASSAARFSVDSRAATRS